MKSPDGVKVPTSVKLNNWAAKIFWLLGAGTLVISIPLAVASLYRGPLWAIGVAVFVLALFFAAYSLPRRLFGVRWWSPVLCALLMLFFVTAMDANPLGIFASILPVVLVISSWRLADEYPNYLKDRKLERPSVSEVAVVVITFLVLALLIIRV